MRVILGGKNIALILIVAYLSFIFAAAYAQEGVLQGSDWQTALPCAGNETRPCGSNIGACEQGIRVCTDTIWGECDGGIEPVTEICSNGIDDDCNGLTDECISSLWIILIVLGVVIIVILWVLMKI